MSTIIKVIKKLWLFWLENLWLYWQLLLPYLTENTNSFNSLNTQWNLLDSLMLLFSVSMQSTNGLVKGAFEARCPSWSAGFEKAKSRLNTDCSCPLQTLSYMESYINAHSLVCIYMDFRNSSCLIKWIITIQEQTTQRINIVNLSCKWFRDQWFWFKFRFHKGWFRFWFRF